MAFTMSRLDHLAGRSIRPPPEYVGTRSAISSHSESVKSAGNDRHDPSILPPDPVISKVYDLQAPHTSPHQHKHSEQLLTTTRRMTRSTKWTRSGYDPVTTTHSAIPASRR